MCRISRRVRSLLPGSPFNIELIYIQLFIIIYSFFLNRDYLNRIAFYNKSQWQCAVTGRQGLTYEEALENEKKHREQLKKFPRGLKQHILQMVQFSKYMIFKYFAVSSPSSNL